MVVGWRVAAATLPYSQGGAHEVDAGAPAGVSARYIDADGGSDTNDVRTLGVCVTARVKRRAVVASNSLVFCGNYPGCSLSRGVRANRSDFWGVSRDVSPGLLALPQSCV